MFPSSRFASLLLFEIAFLIYQPNSLSSEPVFTLEKPVDDDNDLGRTGAVVVNLMKGLPGKGYRFFTDNYYKSFELEKHMFEKKC